jgi:hypothetical protein
MDQKGLIKKVLDTYRGSWSEIVCRNGILYFLIRGDVKNNFDSIRDFCRERGITADFYEMSDNQAAFIGFSNVENGIDYSIISLIT